MKSLQVGEFKRKFSEILDHVRNGEEITITFGKKREKVAILLPYDKYKNKNKRKLGILKNRASFRIKDNFKITDDELIKS